jgi:hypothetical protein
MIMVAGTVAHHHHQTTITIITARPDMGTAGTTVTPSGYFY